MAVGTIQEKIMADVMQIHDAERVFLSGQQEMLGHSSHPELMAMIQNHIAQTQEQIANLEQIIGTFGTSVKPMQSDAARGLVLEGQIAMREADTPEARDLTIAEAAARVEHYEIASYRGLITVADQAGADSVAAVLRRNLQQEEQTAHLLENTMPALAQRLARAVGE